MNDIDFLPKDYVCVQMKRSKSNWLRCLFVVVGALIAIGWGAQQRSMAELSARRNQMQDQATTLLSRLDPADLLKAELDHLENDRKLVDALRSNPPPSRWLGAIVGVLPPQTVLSDIKAEIDEGVDLLAKIDGPAGWNKPNEIKITDPIELDLQRISKVVPRKSIAISIRGTAADDLEVSQFLNGLHQNGLFERVQLLFTDQKFQGGNSVRSFAIRMRTQPLTVRIAQPKSKKTTSQNVATFPGEMTSAGSQGR